MLELAESAELMSSPKPQTKFGELQSRIVVSLSPQNLPRLKKIAARYKVPLTKLGVVGGKRFIIEGCLDLPLAKVENAWRGSLERALGG